MTTAVTHAGYMTGRHLRALSREPWYLAFTLVQPLVYLLIFGALFEKVALIPGFEGDYIGFFAPGIVVMSALFAASWNGLATLEDLERGTLDRFLVSPAWRGSLIIGPIAQAVASVLVQSLVIVVVAWLVGAQFASGLVGIALLVLSAALVAAPFAALSNATALTARSEQTMVGMVNFIAMPATFLSGAFMPIELAPGWIQTVARYNPVNWAVEAGHAAVAASVDWSVVISRFTLLALLSAVMGAVATRAFRSYQRTV